MCELVGQQTRIIVASTRDLLMALERSALYSTGGILPPPQPSHRRALPLSRQLPRARKPDRSALHRKQGKGSQEGARMTSSSSRNIYL
jgi:hypothetical protein